MFIRPLPLPLVKKKTAGKEKTRPSPKGAGSGGNNFPLDNASSAFEYSFETGARAKIPSMKGGGVRKWVEGRIRGKDLIQQRPVQ